MQISLAIVRIYMNYVNCVVNQLHFDESQPIFYLVSTPYRLPPTSSGIVVLIAVVADVLELLI